MKITSFNNKGESIDTQQFADKPTELDSALEQFTSSMEEIAAGMDSPYTEASIALADPDTSVEHVASVTKLVSTSTAAAYRALSNSIDLAKRQINIVQRYVDSGVLMMYDIYDVFRTLIDKYSSLVQTQINGGARLMKISESHKKAYYESLKVMHGFRTLVYDFNEAVSSYNKLHNTNLTRAKTSFKFFKMQVDDTKIST